MKKIISLILICFTLFSVSCSNLIPNKKKPYVDGVSYYSKADGDYFSFYDGETWNQTFIQGVNIGAGKPGAFPGELQITKEEYLKWFEQISEMNANTIRVYTIQKPLFYDALLEFNRKSKKPLNLMHGVWVNEEDILNLRDAHNTGIKDVVMSEAKDLIDVLHGNANIPERVAHASGKYTSDVSQYTIGLILGIEWEADFVVNTNEENPDKSSYTGEYLYTEDASPFESFLCELGDTTIKYETENYNTQVPISFSNWSTTDMLDHPNEPLKTEDMVTVNMENIKSNDSFKPGLFASYHTYPFYPDFMNFQHEYAEYIDERGNKNPYKAYLSDLIKEHTMPVVIAEFGVPSSRGLSHKNIHSGFNHGNIDEKTQAEMNVSLFEDIYNTGYAGAIVFSWQDEWFKKVWSNSEHDLPNRRAYWANTQTSEQSFGLLAFDPGYKESVSYVDGDPEEWKKRTPLISSNTSELFVNYDEKFLYFMLRLKDPNLSIEDNRIIIPIDITPNSGSTIYENKALNKPADFVIDINGKDNSKVKVHSYYDLFYYDYSILRDHLPLNPDYEVSDSTIFNDINVCINRKLTLPQDNIVIPLEKHETGKLTFGDANPESEDFNSLADLNFNENILEIKIPWQLLNVMDPSSKMIMDDFHTINKISPLEVKNLHIGAYTLDSEKISLSMEPYGWNAWDIPTYHERLKPAYYSMQEAMGNTNERIKEQ